MGFVVKRIIADFDNGQLPQREIFGGNAGTLHSERHKIAVGYVAWETVGDNQIAEAVVVEIGGGRSPTPIGFGHISIKANVAEFHRRFFCVSSRQKTLIELQRVSHVLVSVAVLVVIEVGLVVVRTTEHFLPHVVAGLHIYRNHVGQAVVVHIHHVVAHGRIAGVFEILRGLVAESPVLVVDVKQIVG